MRDGLRARAFRSAAPATCLDCAASTYRSVSLSRWFSRSSSTAVVEVRMTVSRWVGRAIGLDVHRDFCEVAICEDGEVRSGARVPSTPEEVGAAGAEPGAVGSGGVGGDGQLLG